MSSQPQSHHGFFRYGLDALAGVISAFVLGFAISHAGSVLVLFAYIATIPLFMAGFSGGFVSGVVAVACGVAGLAATAPAEVAVFYVIADALPALMLIFIGTRRRIVKGALQWSGEGSLLTALTLYPCLIFFAAYAAAQSSGGLLQMTVDAFAGVSDQAIAMMKQNSQDVTAETALKVHQYMDMAARVAPALGMCAWLFSTMIALIVAQSLLCQQGWSLRPAFTLGELRLPFWVAVLAVAACVVGYAAPAPYNYVGLNVALTLSVPFFLAGLAVVHALAARARHPMAILVLFYVVIGVVLYLVPLVALIGIADQAIDFRKRLAERKI